MDYYDDEDEDFVPPPRNIIRPKLNQHDFEDEDEAEEITRPAAKANFRNNPRPKKNKIVRRKSSDEVDVNMSVHKAKRILSMQTGRKGRPSRDVRVAKKVLASAGIDFKPRRKIKKLEKTADAAAKRGRGRPRKHPATPIKPKRPRGRPKKEVPEAQANAPKRPRGRPRKNPADPSQDN